MTIDAIITLISLSITIATAIVCALTLKLDLEDSILKRVVYGSILLALSIFFILLVTMNLIHLFINHRVFLT